MPAVELNPPIADEVPWSDHVTDYDRSHFIVYVRLLDAKLASMDESEMCELILRIDPTAEPDRAITALASHLRRAKWMTEAGYRDLLAS